MVLWRLAWNLGKPTVAAAAACYDSLTLADDVIGRHGGGWGPRPKLDERIFQGRAGLPRGSQSCLSREEMGERIPAWQSQNRDQEEVGMGEREKERKG